jgi:hypothetical protein
VLANTSGGEALVDSIELFNASSTTIDLSGWYLSDSGSQPQKYRLPAGTVLAPGGYLVIDENDFNPNPANPGPNHFALSAGDGDDVWLFAGAPNGGLSTFVDDVHFGPSAAGESLGRIPNGSGRLAPQSIRTLGAVNAASRVSPVILSEIQYAPGPPSAAALAIDPSITSQDLAFIELHNASTETIELTRWELTGGIAFRFGSGTSLAPGATLVITSFSPSIPGAAARWDAFRAQYGIDDSIIWQGPYDGTLRQYGTLLQSLRPDPTAGGPVDTRPLVLADEVLYDNRLPWPIDAAGSGRSLTRRSAGAHGNTADSWQAGDPTPGTVAAPAADFNRDGRLNAQDIDLLCAAVLADEPQVDLRFDLDADLEVDRDDYQFMLDRVLRVSPGDTNLDGIFNSSDLVLVFQAGEYEDSAVDNTSWSEGDWNCDGEFTTADLVAAFQAGSYSANARRSNVAWM